jgi:hypothetical protein
MVGVLGFESMANALCNLGASLGLGVFLVLPLPVTVIHLSFSFFGSSSLSFSFFFFLQALAFLRFLCLHLRDLRPSSRSQMKRIKAKLKMASIVYKRS